MNSLLFNRKPKTLPTVVSLLPREMCTSSTCTSSVPLPNLYTMAPRKPKSDASAEHDG